MYGVAYISGSFCIIAETSNFIVLENYSGKGGCSFWMICLMTAYIFEGLGRSYQGINQMIKPINKSRGRNI